MTGRQPPDSGVTARGRAPRPSGVDHPAPGADAAPDGRPATPAHREQPGQHEQRGQRDQRDQRDHEGGSATARLEGDVASADRTTTAQPRRRLRGVGWLPLWDGLTLFGLALAIGTLRFGGQTWPRYSLAYSLSGFALAAAIAIGVLYLGGNYEREPRLGRPTRLPRLAGLMLVTAAVAVTIAFLTGRYLMPTINLGVWVLFGPLALAAVRAAYGRISARTAGPPGVLLVGDPELCRTTAGHLAAHSPAVPVIGHAAPDQLEQSVGPGVTDVLLLSSDTVDERFPERLAELRRREVDVHLLVTPRDTVLGLRGVREVAGMPAVTLTPHALPPSRARCKRLLELGAVVLGTPLLAGVGAVVALYVRVIAGRPVLLRQQRVGQAGRPFTMLKFRTMVHDAEVATGVVLSPAVDPRVLRGCGWLRALRLDELPQVWNVVRGEMSLVGPRPERPERTATLTRQLPGYDRRHELPPGITGLAQVEGHYDTDPAYKLGYDLQYLVNWSPVLDLQILVRTVWVVLRRLG